MRMKRERRRSASRSYIIALSRSRSRLALLASLITISFSAYGIIGGIVIYAETGIEPREIFRYFTINTNCLTAFAACMIIPFAVEGMRKKYFSYPKWAAMIHYCGMVCTTLTMITAVGLISLADPEMAFGGYNLYLHVICPVMVMVSFFMVESGFDFTFRDSVIACIPAWIYGLIYLWQVALIGETNGGWEDLYHVLEYLPFPVALAVPAYALIVLGLALLIQWLYNRLTRRRLERMNSRLWPEDVDPAEINIEIFGLGRYMGKHADVKFVELPLDLLGWIADRYGLETESLIRPYIRGFMDSMKERKDFAGSKKLQGK